MLVDSDGKFGKFADVTNDELTIDFKLSCERNGPERMRAFETQLQPPLYECRECSITLEEGQADRNIVRLLSALAAYARLSTHLLSVAQPLRFANVDWGPQPIDREGSVGPNHALGCYDRVDRVAGDKAAIPGS
ncbi:hypothetical protein IT40_00690 [Paracoccus versutus]|nr:hypothetical protein IT40_00690 [Paracoccus versutus]